MSRLEKRPREIDRDFLAFVRQHVCAVCCESPVDAHHLKTKATGGSDRNAVPLCKHHHMEWHALGNRLFTERHSINLWKVSAALLVEWFRGTYVKRR